MLKIFKTVGVLSAIGLLVGLFYSINSPTVVKDTPSSNAAPQTKLEPTTEVQPAATGQDPFKKFLDEKKSNNLNSSVKPDNSQAIPVQTGKDPFKEFLDKQKQNSKDQVVSPFGKN
jgi:hypothetical protein